MLKRPAKRVAVGSAAALTWVMLGVVPASAYPGGNGAGAQKVEMGFFEQWGIYSGFSLANADNEGEIADLTDLDYAFGGVEPEGGASENSAGVLADPVQPVQEDPSEPNYNPVVCSDLDVWADYQDPSLTPITGTNGEPEPTTASSNLAGNFEQLAELKAKYPNLKVIMSLGGFNGSAFFSAAASTPAARAAFVSSCIGMFIEGDPGVVGGYNDDEAFPATSASQTLLLPNGTTAGLFNGFDIDWEYPCASPTANNGATGNLCDYNNSNDREDMVLLMQEFREQLDTLSQTTHQQYVLTAEMPAGTQNAVNENPAALAPYVNDEVIMDYDFQGPWAPIGPTNFDSNLYTDPNAPTTNGEPLISVDSTVQYYEQHGVAPSQLVVGIPYYGHGWTGVPAGNDFGLYQSATGPATAPSGLDSASGTADYDLLANLPGYSWHFDPTTGASWLYDPTTETFWSLENPAEVYEKALYVDNHGLAGVSIWNLAGDGENVLTSALTAGLQQGGPGGSGPGFP